MNTCNSSQYKDSEKQRLTLLVSISLIISYFLLPGPAYIATLTVIIAVVPSIKSHSVAIITIFYFSFLIASRYSGLVWDGADDLPSYFLAYDAITSGERDAVSASFFYAKHLDMGFIALTKLLNYFTAGSRFIYYFVLVYLSFFVYYVFLVRALNSRYTLFALVLFLLYFKNVHLSMHILRSSLAIPVILLSLTFFSYKKYLIFLIAGTFQASSTVLASLTLVSKESINKFSFIQKLIGLFSFVVIFVVIGQVYLFGKITHINLSIGLGNYVIILSNIVMGVAFISIANRRILSDEKGKTWVYLYGYFVLVSLLSLAFSHHTYRFSQFVLFLTPLIIAMSISIGKRFDYLQYVLALIYMAGSYYTFYYILVLNESDFYYRNSGDVFINGFDQILLFFDYVDLDVDYTKFWRSRDA